MSMITAVNKTASPVGQRPPTETPDKSYVSFPFDCMYKVEKLQQLQEWLSFCRAQPRERSNIKATFNGRCETGMYLILDLTPGVGLEQEDMASPSHR
jgi:hypothetical protein